MTEVKKLAHLEHDQWLRNRSKPNAQAIAKALHTLDHDSPQPVAPGDALPVGYQSVQNEYVKLPARKRKG
jgi:hypothetical protein